MTDLQDLDALHTANLQDVSASSLATQVPNPLAKDTPNFLVEYGVRSDDHAMIFHFFSGKDQREWNPEFQMDKRLEAAMDAHLDTSVVSAGFTQEIDSFYVFAGGLGGAPDPLPLVEKFLSAIETSPVPSA